MVVLGIVGGRMGFRGFSGFSELGVNVLAESCPVRVSDVGHG